MTENLMNSSHKATNQKYRDEYERIFKAQKNGKIIREMVQSIHSHRVKLCLRLK